jgi:uncharacterized protein YraI
MKRISLYFLLAALLLMALPVIAQDNPNLITLNDATPAIDVVITLPPDTTGTIALDIADALVTVKDAQGNIVFRSADSRIYALEMNILPNTGSHTLTVERLEGMSQAFVSVESLPEMTLAGTTTLAPSNAITLNQEASLSLDNSHPGDTVSVSIPPETNGIITASFYGTTATTQLLDATGIVLAESAVGHIDGLNFVLEGGEYQFTLLSSNLNHPVVAGVRTLAADEAGFGDLAAQNAAAMAVTATSGEACFATIAMSSVNLRSGPGTGYSVLGYAYRDQNFVVGGRNNLNNWVVIGLEDGSSAWMASNVAQFEGNCSTVTVFNTPTRDAMPQEIIITTPEPSVIVIGSNSNSYQDDDHDDDDDEHEDDHDDEHEDDDDD